jgi:signal transduction histidine kinase
VKQQVTTREARAYVDLQVKAVRNVFRDLQKKQTSLERELEEKTLFLEYVGGGERKEIAALHHQIGLGADIIKNRLERLKKRLEKHEPVSDKDLLTMVDDVLLQVQIMSSITSFVTKAKFDLKSQIIHGDLVLFIRQYVERVYIPYNEIDIGKENVTIKVDCDPAAQFEHDFNPFKLIVVIDNLISNSRKAKAKHINVGISVPDERTLEFRVKDDGVGIPDEDLERIFEFGFSKTGGSGIGLYHVKGILKDYGTIIVNNHVDKGVEFIIKVVR